MSPSRLRAASQERGDLPALDAPHPANQLTRVDLHGPRESRVMVGGTSGAGAFMRGGNERTVRGASARRQSITIGITSCLAAFLLLAGCGGSGAKAASPTTSAPVPSTTAEAPTTTTDTVQITTTTTVPYPTTFVALAHALGNAESTFTSADLALADNPPASQIENLTPPDLTAHAKFELWLLSVHWPANAQTDMNALIVADKKVVADLNDVASAPDTTAWGLNEASDFDMEATLAKQAGSDIGVVSQ